MARQLTLLIMGTLLAFAVIRVAMPRGAQETGEQYRLRRAQWATVAAAVVTGYLVAVCVVALNIGGLPDPRGAIAVPALAVALVADALLLRAMWRPVARDRRDAAEAQRADLLAPDAMQDLERRHRGLSGEDVPPTRW